MPAFSASAPGKVILFGEHAVVYGQPAIAVPVAGVSATAVINPAIQAPSGQIHIEAPQIGLEANLSELPTDQPLGAAVVAALNTVGVANPPAFKLRINSTIPVAGGLGSGAAVSVAILRVVTGFLGYHLPNEQISALAFEIEKLHHGTPSGIDNTVVTFGKPVYFIKNQPLKILRVSRPFWLLIADSGIPAPTRETVGAVRAGWQADPEPYEAIFKQIGQIAQVAGEAIEKGDNQALGPLMDQNHALLQKLEVSSPALDSLLKAAKGAGALGAKLSGGGRGGNVIALVAEDKLVIVKEALHEAGAVRVIETKCRSNVE